MAQFHSTLPKSLQPYASRIADYNDERSSDNPIFIGYVKGWKSFTDPVGLLHADAVENVTDAVYHVRNAVPCNCKDCKTHLCPDCDLPVESEGQFCGECMEKVSD
jgi:peptide methionine sulfoxide reductase MsrB